jgi:hypothetical protein
MHHDFVDQATQEGFFLLLRKKSLMPECGKMLADSFERRLELLTECKQRRLRSVLLGFGFLGPFEFTKDSVPAFFKLGSNEAIVRINTQELTLGKPRFITETLQVLMVGMSHLIAGFLLCGNCTAVDIEFDGRERLEKSLYHIRINAITGNMLADGHTVFLTEKVAQITCASLILDNHLVSTLTAVNKPMQQRGPWPWHPSGFVAVVLGIVVQEHGLDVLKRLPRDVGGVYVIDTDLPLFHRESDLLGTKRGSVSA